MSAPPTSNEIVRSDHGGPAFAQQGSLDWVALGRTQYSASIAVLGRLAKAGIDTLTVAFGQAMCAGLPIGSHGEMVLRKSMERLPAKSFAADLLWFGVGVRHILRDLVQTSQGCSLIALCAALTESHSDLVSALVMYEIAKECGGPSELAPSLEQWEALSRVAACVFSGTTLGVRISQISRFGVVDPAAGLSSQRIANPHPPDLAKPLLQIGQIVHGSLQSVSVQGCSACSWLAAWADYVLGLRVLVRDAHGDVVYANYNIKKTFAQVDISFLADEDSGRILSTKSTHLVRSGASFIDYCLQKRDGQNCRPFESFFNPGRLSWNSMFSDMFGLQFESLMKRKDGTTSPLQPFTKREALGDDFLHDDQIFSRMLALVVIRLSIEEVSGGEDGSAHQCFMRTIERIPELRQCAEQTVFAVTNFLTLYGSEQCMMNCPAGSDSSNLENLRSEFNEYCSRLAANCTCPFHQGGLEENIFSCPWTEITIFVIRMITLLHRVILDAPLQPTVHGMTQIYREGPRNGAQFWDSMFTNKSFHHDLHKAHKLFSGDDLKSLKKGTIAHGSGKTYCYTQLLEGLTDDVQASSKIHVGSGHIEYRTKLHSAVYDFGDDWATFSEYPAQRVGVVDTIESLRDDTTSSTISTQLLVQELATHICIAHRISNGIRSALISHTSFFYCLERATSYKYDLRLPIDPRESWTPVLRESQYDLVQGEGGVDKMNARHVVQPLRGNVLGRCLAISMGVYPFALVRTNEDLELFARFWTKEQELIRIKDDEFRYYTLIS